MLRSMFAGVSGLRSHQTMMDVTSNNISNVNTAGYKTTRATFQEALTQQLRGAAAGVAGDTGGANPLQVGLGARVGSVDQVFTQGATQLTGRSTDVAIQGDGFFVLNVGGEQMYTRNGSFSFDSLGQLVGPGGGIVQAAGGGDIVIPDISSYQDVGIAPDGRIMARDDTGAEVELAQIGLAVFDNPNALERIGGSMFAETANSGAPVEPAEETRAALEAGALEMSNVDLAQEFTTLIMAQRGFQANSRTITASDEMLQDLVNLKR